MLTTTPVFAESLQLKKQVQTSVRVVPDVVEFICIRGRRRRLRIPDKDKSSVACDAVVPTGISLKGRVGSKDV